MQSCSSSSSSGSSYAHPSDYSVVTLICNMAVLVLLLALFISVINIAIITDIISGHTDFLWCGFFSFYVIDCIVFAL